MERPVAYSAGTYGWNFDVYEVGGVAICTGYRGMPSKNDRGDYKLMRHYEELSQGKTAEEKRALLKEYVGKARVK
jgi:hypothetical protein